MPSVSSRSTLPSRSSVGTSRPAGSSFWKNTLGIAVMMWKVLRVGQDIEEDQDQQSVGPEAGVADDIERFVGQAHRRQGDCRG